MGVGVARPLLLNRRAGRPAPLQETAKPKRRFGVNALLGIGLWFLLWGGYNTDVTHVIDPSFPRNTTDFIQGVRAFFPIIAGWFSLILVFARSRRLLPWLMTPLGLIILYVVIGLASSLTLSTSPTYALYYGFNYLSIIVILLVLVLGQEPLADLSKVLRFTWIISSFLTLCLLASIPVVGTQITTEAETTVSTLNGSGTVMGMAMARNTGFARYAAVSALALLPQVMRKGNLFVRALSAAGFGVSLYALAIANGRTEILAFICSVAVILGVEKAKRTMNFLAATAVVLILGLRGFYSGFFLYFTRTGRIDPTLTGRTQTWAEAWHVFWDSPFIGFGFQGDRYFLGGQHIHNAFLQAVFQSGLLGGLAMIIAIGITWYYIIYYFFRYPPADKSLIRPEICAVFLFVTISSITESTFAYFSASWLLSAPIVPYVLVLHWQMQKDSLKAAHEQNLRIRLARRHSRGLETPLPVPPSAAAGSIRD